MDTVDEGLSNDGEYELVNSIDAIFSSRPWATPEVRVLRDGAGKPLAFASVAAIAGKCKYRSDLPTEFFNHQLAELDYEDPDKLAAFMSEYGVIGSREPFPGNAAMFSQAVKSLNPADADSVLSFERRTGYLAAGRGFELLTGDDQRDALAHYWNLKDAFLGTGKALAEAQPGANVLTRMTIRALVSYESAVRAFEDWLYCVRHIQAMVRYKTAPELARSLGEDERSVIRCCRGARNILQRRLKNVSPRLDILSVADDCCLRNDECPDSGGFEEALALQIWNFVLEAKGGYTICKECGKVFVHKQTKPRKGASRSTSVFCCDRCKNRFSQREYRKSAGYRLKADGASSVG